MSKPKTVEEFKMRNNYRPAKCCSNCGFVSANGSYCCHPDSIFGELTFGGSNKGKRLIIEDSDEFVCDKWKEQ